MTTSTRELELRRTARRYGLVVVKIRRPGSRRSGVLRVLDAETGLLVASGTFEDIETLLARVGRLPGDETAP